MKTKTSQTPFSVAMKSTEESPVAQSPHQLQESIDFASNNSNNPLWDHYLRQCLAFADAEDESSTWIAHSSKDKEESTGDTAIDSVAHVEWDKDQHKLSSKPTRARAQANIRLFCRDPTDESALAASVDVVRTAIELAFQHPSGSTKSNANDTSIKPPPENRSVTLKFGALDRRLTKHLTQTLSEQYTVTPLWDSKCGLWMYQLNNDITATESKASLSNSVRLRPLAKEDASRVDSTWKYSREGSVEMIEKMIAFSSSSDGEGGCQGLEVVDGSSSLLVAWVCQYLDGTLGMLWTDENHRKKGYAGLVVQAALQNIQNSRQASVGSNSDSILGFIVDGNVASEGLFTRLQWKRVADADWVGLKFERKYSKL